MPLVPGPAGVVKLKTCHKPCTWLLTVRVREQDLLVASLFRNFLLAERVMRAAHCTPASMPRLPASHQHPLWQVRLTLWD